MLFFLIDGSISNQVGTAQTTRVRSAPLMGYAINRSLKNKDQKDIPQSVVASGCPPVGSIIALSAMLCEDIP